MLIIREVLTAKPGPASRLAKLFKKIFGSDPNPENVFMRLTVSVTGGWGEKGSETENYQSHEKRFKNAATPTSLLHHRRMGTSSFTKETEAQWEYTANGQTHKPYKAVETHLVLQSRAAPWFPVQLIHPLVAWRFGVNDPD
jgi:hypothetical protein